MSYLNTMMKECPIYVDERESLIEDVLLSFSPNEAQILQEFAKELEKAHSIGTDEVSRCRLLIPVNRSERNQNREMSDKQWKDFCNQRRNLVVAHWVIYLRLLRHYADECAHFHYSSMEHFKSVYASQFIGISASKWSTLYQIANWMQIFFRMVGTSGVKDLVLDVIPKHVEGYGVKYTRGTKASLDRTYRELIFVTESGVEPRPRRAAVRRRSNSPDHHAMLPQHAHTPLLKRSLDMANNAYPSLTIKRSRSDQSDCHSYTSSEASGSMPSSPSYSSFCGFHAEVGQRAAPLDSLSVPAAQAYFTPSYDLSVSKLPLTPVIPTIAPSIPKETKVKETKEIEELASFLLQCDADGLF